MNSETWNKKLVLSMVMTVSLFVGCHSNSDNKIDLLDQSQYWLNWQGGQSNYATAANIWNGFESSKDFLSARTLTPTLAFYLKNPKPREFVHVVYSCPAPRKVQVFINDQFAFILPPSPKFSRYSISCNQLRKGFNRIRFDLSEGKFRLRALYLQKNGAGFADRNLRQLVAGERFEVYLLPGRVNFEFGGRASLKAESFGIVDDRDLTSPISQSISVSGKKTYYSYNSTTPFVVSISCLQGRAGVSHLWFGADNAKIMESQAAETAAPIDKNKLKDIFIFLVDACQAGHLGLYGYSRNTAPRIFEFARDSVVFKQAFANASYTPGAVGTIFTGLYPNHH
jgi:hypothetical protein